MKMISRFENLQSSMVAVVGIRTLNPHQRKQTGRFGIEIIDM
jgi:hypothetical protein